MKIQSLSDVGYVRLENQDNYWSAILSINGKEAGVICLCDGMGGLSNGGMASRLVVEAVRESMLSTFNIDDIPNILSRVNKDIVGISKKSPNTQMGTTCTLLICYDGMYRVYHIGDSRAYLVRNGVSTLLTTDHSAINMYKINKKENPDLWNKYKSKLTRCIGVKEVVTPDVYKGSCCSGDIFFLCSDGCWHYFDDFAMTKEVISDLQTLVGNCKSNGEKDNITVCTLSI